MISGVHAILFTEEAEAVRDFLSEMLELPSVDAGGGWPIFALPPAELAAHPSDEGGRQEIYLMCDDIAAAVEELRDRGVAVSRPISDEGWGLLTSLELPGGVELGLYEPRHRRPPRD